jgi:hypothetical protein
MFFVLLPTRLRSQLREKILIIAPCFFFNFSCSLGCFDDEDDDERPLLVCV